MQLAIDIKNIKETGVICFDQYYSASLNDRMAITSAAINTGKNNVETEKMIKGICKTFKTFNFGTAISAKYAVKNNKTDMFTEVFSGNVSVDNVVKYVSAQPFYTTYRVSIDKKNCKKIDHTEIVFEMLRSQLRPEIGKFTIDPTEITVTCPITACVQYCGVLFACLRRSAIYSRYATKLFLSIWRELKSYIPVWLTSASNVYSAIISIILNTDAVVGGIQVTENVYGLLGKMKVDLPLSFRTEYIYADKVVLYKTIEYIEPRQISYLPYNFTESIKIELIRPANIRMAICFISIMCKNDTYQRTELCGFDVTNAILTVIKVISNSTNEIISKHIEHFKFTITLLAVLVTLLKKPSDNVKTFKLLIMKIVDLINNEELLLHITNKLTDALR